MHGDRYSRPFEASLQFNAKTTHLAWCATAEQAALLRARALRDAKAALAAERAAAAAAAGEDEEETEGMLSAEEALAKAEAEGLEFARSEKAKSGYKNVYIIDTSSYSNKNAPYHVAFNGKNLGFYESLEHAALVAARSGAEPAGGHVARGRGVERHARVIVPLCVEDRIVQHGLRAVDERKREWEEDQEEHRLRRRLERERPVNEVGRWVEEQLPNGAHRRGFPHQHGRRPPAR